MRPEVGVRVSPDLFPRKHEHELATVLAFTNYAHSTRVAPHTPLEHHYKEHGTCGSSACPNPGCADSRQFAIHSARHGIY
jgi:hypothetical protein